MNKNIKIPLFYIILIIALIVAIIVFLKPKDKESEPVEDTNISLNTPVWIKALTKYTINGTEDTFRVTHDVYLPDRPNGELPSWAQNINYEVTIGDMVYSGDVVLDSDFGVKNSKDQNPLYDVEITSYRNHEINVSITKK